MPKFARRHVTPLGQGGESEATNRPCTQHKVPEITAGMMWAGPEIYEQDRTWQESPAIAPLAYRPAQRRKLRPVRPKLRAGTAKSRP